MRAYSQLSIVTPHAAFQYPCNASGSDGQVLPAQVDKHKLVHQLNVPYRDLRILDPMVGTNPSANHNLQILG